MTEQSSEFISLAAALAGQYELEREIGRGGMGVVYLASDLKLDRKVAIKTLPRHSADSATRDRFLREARTAASLSHPGIVPIYRADEMGGFVFFAMAFIAGPSLAERVKSEGPLGAREAAGYLRDVALALGYAHTRGVIHRDVKAENILVDPGTARALVTDFGIARVVDAAPLTATGHVLGTVHYMSPEQVAGETLDGRTDLYALGVVGFYLLSGTFPFESETASAVLVAHVTKRAPSLAGRAPHVPPALTAIIDRCLAREAAGRFATGEDLARALDDALTSPAFEVEGARPVLLSESQAQSVWRRASELQALTGTQSAGGSRALLPVSGAAAVTGYPLATVRDSAREAGISEQFVARALSELKLVPSDAGTAGTGLAVVEALTPPPGFWAGAPMSVSFEAKVAGEVDEDDYDLLVELIRRQLGDVGQVSTLGRSFAWTATNPKRRVAVTVVPRAGATTIRVEERFSQLAGGIFGGIVGGGGGGFGGSIFGGLMGATRSPVIALAAVGATVGSAWLLARTIFRNTVKGRAHELRELTARLAESISGDLARPRRR